ncbi:MAG: TonB-dependent receptor, partial [Kangiellaceae bacterium]|nr:TonB-dependent receptor [Kangiellaceae bacterium]
MDAKNHRFHCLKMVAYRTATLVITYALLIGVGTALAEDGEAVDITELSLEDLLNLKVTSAAKITQKVSEASSVISVFNQIQVEQYGWQTINQLLYSQPGFGPSQDYDRPTVATRGNFDSWSNNHILHLIDGVPFNDNLYGSAYTWLMPLFTSQTIEVIRGPGSALYGSNATNGVVQMNTLTASDLEGQSRVRLSFGDDSMRRISALTGKVKNELDFILGYSFHDTDGNEYLSHDGSNRLAAVSTPETNRPLSQKFQTRDEKKDSYFWSKLTIGEEWNIQYHRQEWSFDTGHGWVFWIPDFDEDMQEQRDIFSIKHTNKNLNGITQEYVFKYQNHAIQWDQRYYPNGAFADYYPSGMWEYLETDATDIFVRAQITYFQPDTQNTWLAGIEVDRFSYEGDKQHYSNINVDSELFEPFPGDINMPL